MRGRCNRRDDEMTRVKDNGGSWRWMELGGASGGGGGTTEAEVGGRISACLSLPFPARSSGAAWASPG